MSRIGKKIIEIPQGVDINLSAGAIKVKGAKGTLESSIHHTMEVSVENNQISIKPKSTARAMRKYHGLVRSLVQNMVTGVTSGFKKELNLNGVGYRAAMKGKGITLTLGYSHPIEYTPPTDVELKVEKQTTIFVSGPDKQSVGQVAAIIRGFRPPEPYHGKGVKYSDERIIKKAGKSAGKGK